MSHSILNPVSSYDEQALSFIRNLPATVQQKLPQGYYRSKLFIAPLNSNPFIAAAGPLLSLLERLYLTSSLPPIEELRANIEHELQAFHSRINGKIYSEELTAIAHYLLTATIDELIGKNYLRVYGTASQFQAFTTASAHDNKGPETRFFDLINHLKQAPNQYLDLIELAYYCLIAGFEGEQHAKSDGRQILDNLLDDLYQLIQNNRVHKPQQLFNEQTELATFPEINKMPWKLGLIGLGLLIFSYGASHWLLQQQTEALEFGHSLTFSLDD